MSELEWQYRYITTYQIYSSCSWILWICCTSHLFICRLWKSKCNTKARLRRGYQSDHDRLWSRKWMWLAAAPSSPIQAIAVKHYEALATVCWCENPILESRVRLLTRCLQNLTLPSNYRSSRGGGKNDLLLKPNNTARISLQQQYESDCSVFIQRPCSCYARFSKKILVGLIFLGCGNLENDFRIEIRTYKSLRKNFSFHPAWASETAQKLSSLNPTIMRVTGRHRSAYVVRACQKCGPKTSHA